MHPIILCLLVLFVLQDSIMFLDTLQVRIEWVTVQEQTIQRQFLCVPAPRPVWVETGVLLVVITQGPVLES